MATINGLQLVVPSSVAGTGVSVSATGKVTFSGSTSVSVNDCFTSTYDNYLIVVQYISSTLAGNGMGFRVRASGTDVTASEYTNQTLYAQNTSLAANRITQTLLVATINDTTNRSASHLYVYGPALAQQTAFRSHDVSGSGPPTIYQTSGTHSQTVAYDGFTLMNGNFTGTLTIYGFAQ